MGKSKTDYAREILIETLEDLGRAGALTLGELIAQGVDPEKFDSGVEFQAALIDVVLGKMATEQPTDPPSGLTDAQIIEAAEKEYAARVQNANTPEELAAIVRENEALLSAEADAERAEIQRRAELSYAIRERERKAEGRPEVGHVREDELANLEEPDPTPMPGKTPHAIPEITSEELEARWIREGRKVPRADDEG